MERRETRHRVLSGSARISALAPFSIPSYRLQWPADLLTSCAFEVENLVLGWYILMETGSVLLLTVVGALVYAGFLVLRTFIHGGDVPGYPSLMVAILFFGGVQLLSLGVLGEYVGRILVETKHRPIYVVRETIGTSLQPMAG